MQPGETPPRWFRLTVWPPFDVTVLRVRHQIMVSWDHTVGWAIHARRPDATLWEITPRYRDESFFREVVGVTGFPVRRRTGIETVLLRLVAEKTAEEVVPPARFPHHWGPG